jgi:hypothetical protein
VDNVRTGADALDDTGGGASASGGGAGVIVALSWPLPGSDVPGRGGWECTVAAQAKVLKVMDFKNQK